MGDAVRRVQKHLQDLSRDHLVGVEDRHHANLGWLQIEFQRLCKQIEVDVRVELTRPPRMSFSKPPIALVGGSTSTHAEKPDTNTTTTAPIAPPATSQPAKAVAHAEAAGPQPKLVVEKRKTKSPIKLDFSSEEFDSQPPKSIATKAPVAEQSQRRIIKRMVKRTRTVMKPRRVVKTERRAIKPTKPQLPAIDVGALKVVDLKNELKKRGLKQTGVKAVLAVRLKEALDEEDALEAMDKDGEEAFEDVEVVEEVMEEVQEEYEEEIEEEVEEAASRPASTSMNASRVTATSVATIVIEDDSDSINPENQRMSIEDFDIDLTTRLQSSLRNSTKSKDEAAKAVKEITPDKSLSELVDAPSADEIVRESDDFASPAGRELPVKYSKAASKSPTLPTVSESAPASTAAVAQPSNAAPVKETLPKPVNERVTAGTSILSKLREESAKRAAAMLNAAKDLVSAAPQVKTPGSEPPAAKPVSSMANQNVADGDDSHRASASTTSVSSRSSSSISPFADPAQVPRAMGNTSIVGDSQPSQFNSSIQPGDVLSTRSASISQLDIRSVSARMKTPEAPISIERASQSEPKVVVKPSVETEEQRRQREHQESIEREALRIRLAMKQSARKRFEEAKGSTSFWARREQAKQEQQRASPPSPHRESIVSLPRESTSPAPTTPSTEESAPSVQPPAASAPVIVELPAFVKGTDIENHSLVPSKPVDVAEKKLELSKTQSKTSTMATASSMAKKAADTKRVFLPRKRSSIVVVDGSTSNLYPSKRRLSQTRGREDSENQDPQPAKRTSASSAKSLAVNAPVKRGSWGRDEPAKSVQSRKRPSGSLERSIQPPVKKRARSSADSDLDVVSSYRAIPKAKPVMRKRDSASSSISSSSNKSGNDAKSSSMLPGTSLRKPSNLVSGLHSFTSLLEKDAATISSSQGSNASASSRQAPVVSALKLAEKNRLIEQKKNLEKMKRKEALVKRYEEQRKLDEDKKKKLAQMKEKAERDARLKREQEKTTEKRQRELELAKKRQQRIQEMRAGLEKKKLGIDGASAKTTVTAPIIPRLGAPSTLKSTASSASSRTLAAKRPDHKELTTYAMSEHEPSESELSDGDKDNERNSKNIPRWAQRDNLERILRHQFSSSVDPTPAIFPEFDATCDLEAIFEPTDVRKKKRFQRRTSSGNWLADRTTTRERAVYKRDMGFQR